MSNPIVDDDSEIQVYVATSTNERGTPRIVITGSVVNIHFGGSYAPYQSMTIHDWRILTALVDEAINAQAVSA